ncbi:claudin-34 [Electrophorus electricus]|uniref:claudin-34 n=1 Tax=Electrophorus electricus TaxID=8005 RepID=UPI0015D026A1|nr:claudin-34 [Electrophorus electricus]XP_026869394.2 claudin-34 [Electrophorus electricus]XP_026869397.2 claudin-34 [Electrophorus electricus]
MVYLVHTAHWQFLGLVLAVLGLILTAASSGVNDWRVWYVEDMSVITSGVAWVGIWRACFYTHVLDTTEFCQSISIMDPFVPPEIAAAQVLCMTAAVVGIAGNLVAGYAVKQVYFNIHASHIKLAFSLAGTLYFLTAACSLVPVIWNMSVVLVNSTIDFPAEFHLPPAPVKQEVGLGIVIGAGSSLLLIISGMLFVCYRQPIKSQKSLSQPVSTEEEDSGIINRRSHGFHHGMTESRAYGQVNLAFEREETF